MRIRMAYNKIKKQFDADAQEFANQIITDELRELSEKLIEHQKRMLDLTS